MAEFFSTLAGAATTKLLVAVLSAIVVVIFGKFVIKILDKSIVKLKVDPTLHRFLMGVAKVVVYFAAIMIVAGSLGFEMSSLVALASVVSAAFALAASGVLSNIFGGLLLLLTKPFGVGDYVKIGGDEGLVQEIGLVATKINTLDNKRITIPNSSISSATIYNFSTEGKRRVDLVFNVGYDAPVEEVKAAILSVANAHAKVIDKESTFVRLSSYNGSDMSYTMRAWCATADYWDVYFDLMEQVKVELDKRGLKMTYQIINVISK